MGRRRRRSTCAARGPTATATTTPRCSTPSATRWPSTPTCASSPWPACKGWPLRHFDLPEGVLKIAGRELQEWTRPLQRPELLANVRLDIAGVEKIPQDGPGDRRVQPPQLLRRHRRRHRARPDRPLVPLPRQEGGVRRPGHRVPARRWPAASASTARRARASRWSTPSGRCRPARRSSLAPGGHDPAWAGVLRPRAARAAGAPPAWPQATHAPVIPVGLWGTEKVWPRNRRLPRFDLAERPEIRVRVGDPVDLKHRSLDADTKRIMAALVDQLPDEARVAHDADGRGAAPPRIPPGYRGDPTREARTPPRHRHLTRRARGGAMAERAARPA